MPKDVARKMFDMRRRIPSAIGSGGRPPEGGNRGEFSPSNETYNRLQRGRGVTVALEPSKLPEPVRFRSPALDGEPVRHIGAWRSLVAHSAGGRKVAGS